MTTLDFTSTSAGGIRQIADPLISAGAIVANLGSHPAITVPMIAGGAPDVDWIWDYLDEAADFFGIAAPTRDDLRLACERFSTSAAVDCDRSLLAVTIVLIELDGRAQFVVTGGQTRRVNRHPVRIAMVDGSTTTPEGTEPLWRRMATRTTSRGEADQLQRWLNVTGHDDQVARYGKSIGPPALGALILDHRDALVGIETTGVAGILWSMSRCGAIRPGMISATTEFTDVHEVSSAWWISPRFELHPVRSIGDQQFRIESALVPRFLARLP